MDIEVPAGLAQAGGGVFPRPGVRVSGGRGQGKRLASEVRARVKTG